MISDSKDEKKINTEETLVRFHQDITPSGTARRGLATQRAYLEVTGGVYHGQRFYLEQKDCLIGRSPDASILLVDDSVSRHHAKLKYQNDEFILLDLGSKNGTFLNGTSVHECPLHTGDEITIGNHTLQYLFEAILIPSI